MLRLIGALVFVLILPAIAQSQPDIAIQVPYAGIRVAPDIVIVETPWIGLRIPRATPVRMPARTAPAPAPGAPAVPPPPAPSPDNRAPVVSQFVPAQPPPDVPPASTVPVRDPLPLLPNPVPGSRKPEAILTASTLQAFASSFQAGPGTYEAVLVHPFTNQPVKVSFTLPEGAPRKVHVTRHSIEWDYGPRFVQVNFFRNGDVQVKQR
jgi:hypothetical protein